MGNVSFFMEEIYPLKKISNLCSMIIGKVCIRAKWPIRPELIPVSVA